MYADYNEVQKGLLDTFEPITTTSMNYKNWRTVIDLKTCLDCVSRNGQIYEIDKVVIPSPPLHLYCRCEIKNMEAISAGGATKDGVNGADFWIKYHNILPEYYVTEEDAKNEGWRWGKSPSKFIPGKMITRGLYDNKDNHLPQKANRVWYEADINYYEGRRNGHRILYSNDGLIFVTYDHYRTFYEII